MYRNVNENPLFRKETLDENIKLSYNAMQLVV